MVLWGVTWGLSIAFVALLVVAELHAERTQGRGGVHPSRISRVFSKTVLVVTLSIALHAVIDPDHHAYTHSVHASQVLRASYGFAVTGALLYAFHNLRIVGGALIVVLAVSAAELLQWAGVLPGIFRAADWAAGLVGVGVAAGPMWLGAQRARRNMAWEQRRETQRDGGQARRGETSVRSS